MLNRGLIDRLTSELSRVPGVLAAFVSEPHTNHVHVVIAVREQSLQVSEDVNSVEDRLAEAIESAKERMTLDFSIRATQGRPFETIARGMQALRLTH